MRVLKRSGVSAMELSQRQERVLSCVVAGYSRTGEPVGSKAVAQEMGVSSATVRNEMAELIELGLLEQPHTSAGRVPSLRGYREYLDRLMQPQPLEEREKAAFDSALLGSAYDPESLLLKAAQLLAGATRYGAIATTPGGADAVVKAVQFVQTGRRAAMLVLLSSAGTMETKVFRCDFDLTPELTRLFFRVFNERAAGKKVSELTPAFAQTMAASLGEMYVLVGAPLQALLEAARDTAQAQVVLSGQMNLLYYPELGQAGLRQLLELLERREDIIGLLQGRPGHVKVLIGRESGRLELEEAALAVARYRVNGQDAGSIGSIGPVRMDYPRVVSLLDYLAGLVGRALTRMAQEGQE